MSRPTSLDELKWWHDCTLIEMLYDASSERGRVLRWTVHCPEDLGYEPWNGRTLVLTAVNVAMLKHMMWAVAGPDTVDAVRPDTSNDMREKMAEAQRLGVRFPSIEFTMTMHSGSWMEVVCEKLEIETAG